jgi:hypothetical protein
MSPIDSIWGRTSYCICGKRYRVLLHNENKMHLSIQLTEAKIYFASRIASKDQNSDEHSKETRPNLKPKIEVIQ